MIAALADDLRWASRYVTRRPMFAGAVVMTLAVTIAAATTAFGLAEAVLWRQLPFATMEQRLLAAISAQPGVRGVATAYDHPLEANWSESPLIVGDTAAPDQRQAAELRIVSPGYFEALNVVLLDGRVLTERDGLDAPGAVVVNEAFAQQLGGRVLGRRLQTGTPRFLYGPAVANEFEIVGVVGNERFRGLEQTAQPAFYLSTRQFPQQAFTLLIRTSGDPVQSAADIRRTVRSVNAAVTFGVPTSLGRILIEQLGTRRITTNVIGGFALAALALAGLGLYSLLRIVLARRTQEIAIRLALGASPQSVSRHMLRDGALSAAAGVLGGAGLALIIGQLIRSLLVGVSAIDPLTFVIVPTALLTLALVTATGPARRAARIDPVQALRGE